MISAVPRARAVNVRGGSEHATPPGLHTMLIGETPGARTAGLVEAGEEGYGNCAAITFVPTATWKVMPFWAGVTVIVPCTALGDEAGGFGGVGRGDGERGGAGVVVRAPEGELLAEADDGAELDPVGPAPPGTPVVVPVAEPDGLDGGVPVP